MNQEIVPQTRPMINQMRYPTYDAVKEDLSFSNPYYDPRFSNSVYGNDPYNYNDLLGSDLYKPLDLRTSYLGSHKPLFPNNISLQQSNYTRQSSIAPRMNFSVGTNPTYTSQYSNFKPYQFTPSQVYDPLPNPVLTPYVPQSRYIPPPDPYYYDYPPLIYPKHPPPPEYYPYEPDYPPINYQPEYYDPNQHRPPPPQIPIPPPMREKPPRQRIPWQRQETRQTHAEPRYNACNIF